MTQHRRRTDRIATKVDVVLATVLTRESATIIDISEGGAQITGTALAKGTRFMIELGDDVVYAAVAWEEEDRMGVRFQHTLKAGPLYELAQRAKVLAGIEKSKQTARAVAVHSAVELVGPLIRPGRRVFGRKVA
ncbi:MAG: PilZ domain-containing protein [Oxalobacteraceae bacterium]|nr:MAG: PilZ domain-containing protein [Oxalobacteraceae bacterium]